MASSFVTASDNHGGTVVMAVWAAARRGEPSTRLLMMQFRNDKALRAQQGRAWLCATSDNQAAMPRPREPAHWSRSRPARRAGGESANRAALPNRRVGIHGGIEDVGCFGGIRRKEPRSLWPIDSGNDGAYLGRTPKRYQSGETDVALGNSRQGTQCRGIVCMRPNINRRHHPGLMRSARAGGALY